MTDYINTPGLKYDYLLNNGDTNTKTNDVINTMFSLLVEADKYLTSKSQKSCFNYTHTKINLVSQIPKPSMYDSHFFPIHIQEYIDDNAIHSIQYTCKIHHRSINVYFILNDDIYDSMKNKDIQLLDKYIHMIYMWVYTIDSFSNKQCSKTMTLYMYFTPFEKKLPDNQMSIIDAKHVNTAYTTGCREKTEIVLYRTEEWFKVFIHETFHNFGLDFSDMNLYSINKKLREDIFNVNIEFNVYESYCEFWARTINCMMYTYLQLQKTNTLQKRSFQQMFKFHMEGECRHSLFQALKILDFMGLTYDNIIKKHNDKDTESIQTCNYLYRRIHQYLVTTL